MLDPTGWDTVTIGNQPFPGIAQVRVSRSRKLDVKKPPGIDGATITCQGYEPAKVEIRLVIWTPKQSELLQQILPLIENAPGKEPPNGWAITHPAAQMRNVNAIIFQDISGPEPSSIQGAMEMKFTCLEWYPKPKNAVTKTPKQVAPRANALAPTPAATDPSSQSTEPLGAGDLRP